jgi:methionyl aminopeptidase
MRIILKSRREIEQMRRTGKAAHDIVAAMCAACEPGVTTREVNEIARKMLEACGGVGTSKNYPTYKPGEGFPAETCVSVNEVVVHGIPGNRRLESGDIVTCDCAMILDGHCADHAVTVGVGDVSDEAATLLEHGRNTLHLALEQMQIGRMWSEVAGMMEQYAVERGYGVVQEFVGHGVGRSMHEDPKVPNFVNPEQLKTDFKIRPGLTVAVEPMLVVGRREVEQLKDGWTVVTKNRKLSCHFEHTVAVTKEGTDVLTDGREPWGL